MKRINEIDVSAFKNIHIHFKGDVYVLALWVALSNKAQSTKSKIVHTTLHGFASKFSFVHSVGHDNSLKPGDIMRIFRKHGIKDNPILRLGEDAEVYFTGLLAKTWKKNDLI